MPPAAELRRPKILIAGSGVGGLATAVALRRDGLDVEVLEQAAGPEEIRVGGGLHLWPNAMRGLQRLGLADTVARAGETIDRLEWLTPDGLRIAGVDLRATARALGAPAVGVRRSDLLGVLLDAAGEETISFGLEVSGFEQDAAGVTVRCTDGRVVRGDVLVGADGLRSTIRAHVLGDAELRSPGVHVYQAVAEGGTPAPAAVFAEVWGTGVRCGYYPVRQGTFWFAFVRTAELTTRDGTNARRMLLALTHDWTAPPRGLLEATPESAIAHSELVARDPVDRWSDGRVTLLGDAAHPMTPFTGQGACQAIEDAVVLSSCLREEPDVATALGRYELERVPRTTEVARRSWAAASAAGSRDRALSPRTSRAFAATFERVIWRQLEQTIGYEF